MRRNYKIYLKDILRSMESIEKFVANMNFEKFKGEIELDEAYFGGNWV